MASKHDVGLAEYAAQDRLINAMFKSLPAGRRYRIAMFQLRFAAEELGKLDVVAKQLRDEVKFVAKLKAQKTAEKAA